MKHPSKKKVSTEIISNTPNHLIMPFILPNEFKSPSIIQNQTLKTLNQLSKVSTQKSNFSGIFWNKLKVANVWNKLKYIKKKVYLKKEDDYLKITNAIIENKDDYVIKMLTNESFKKFYRNKDELYPKNVFFDIMIENLKFELIIKVAKDEAYQFDYEFIFEYIKNMLSKKKADKMSISKKINDFHEIPFDKEISNQKYQKDYYENSPSQLFYKSKSILTNLIRYDLYPQNNSQKVKILAWFFAFFEYTEIFHLLVSKKENADTFTFEKNIFNFFQSSEDIMNYSKDSSIFKEILKYCLESQLEYLAYIFCEFNPHSDITGLSIIAAETSNLQFLKYLWERNNKTKLHVQKLNFPTKNDINRFSFGNQSFVHSKITDINKILQYNNGDFLPNFSINSVIKTICKNYADKASKPKEINSSLSKLLYWKNIEKDSTFIDSLFQYNCFEQISTLVYMWPGEFFLKPEYFRAVILKKEIELIIYFLHKRELRHVLSDHSIQEFIVNEYTSHGEKLYYASEMFTYIFKSQWKSELTKLLCKNIKKAIKTKDILNCHSPILTCLLLSEFLIKIKGLSIVNVSRCEKIMSELIEYCKNIQESNPKESYISFLMKQKDTRNRSAFQIASEKCFYSLLETAEIGIVVKKMWDGKLSYNSFYTASSLHRYMFDNDKKVTDPFNSFDTLDTNKVYFFQLCVWIDSCLLRFYPGGFNTIIMVATYNIFIYVMNLEGRLLNNFSELSTRLSIFLIIYLFLVTSSIFDYILKIIFSCKSRRPFKLESWSVIDFLLFIFAWLILLDTKQIGHLYLHHTLDEDLKHYLWNIQLPFIKILKTETDDLSLSVAIFLRVIILSVNDVLVWIRVCGILLIFKEMGPVIRMILSMALYLVKYIVVIALFLAWCATVFTVIFNRYSQQFVSFSTSIITLFGGFLNNFDVSDFEEGKKYFGSLLFMAYACVAGVLLVNLLIAVLSNVYEQMAKVVDASHRSVLIQYYKKYKWDHEYGYLMFLTSPLSNINILTLLIEQIFFHGKDKKKNFNKYTTRLYYLFFYFPFIMGVFLVYSFVLIPLCMVKGLVMMIQYENSLKILRMFKVINCFRWLISGIFYLLYVYFRDIVYCFIYVFKEADKKVSDFQRIKKNLTNEDVVIFLKFIHSKNTKTIKRDIHSLFMAYLEFEASEKAQVSDTFKKRKEYLSKLDKAVKQTSLKSQTVGSRKIFLYNDIEEGTNASKLYTSYIRKNLMIIEILENFIIYDEMGENVVDIEKMKKLLPLTMNIQNFHLRRLIHSNVHALNQAMEKLKFSKTAFFEYQLVNKIMLSAQRLDKEVDSEIFKIQRMRSTEPPPRELRVSKRRDPIDEISDIDKSDVETDTNGEEDNKKEINLIKKFDDMIKEMKTSVGEIKKGKEKRGSLFEPDKSSKCSKKTEQSRHVNWYSHYGKQYKSSSKN